MLISFFVAVGLVLALVILRAYSFGEDAARYLAKAELDRFKTEMPSEEITNLPEDEFINYFEWLRRRRFWLYLVVFAGIVMPTTLATMIILSFVKVNMDPGPWLWGFIALFALVLTWTASAAATLYIHKVRRDGSLLRNLPLWKKINETSKAR
jgi:hypothetical protein